MNVAEKENCHVLVNQFHGNFRSKTPICLKIMWVFRDVKWCNNASWGLKGLIWFKSVIHCLSCHTARCAARGWCSMLCSIYNSTWPIFVLICVEIFKMRFHISIHINHDQSDKISKSPYVRNPFPGIDSKLRPTLLNPWNRSQWTKAYRWNTLAIKTLFKIEWIITSCRVVLGISPALAFNCDKKN